MRVPPERARCHRRRPGGSRRVRRPRRRLRRVATVLRRVAGQSLGCRPAKRFCGAGEVTASTPHLAQLVIREPRPPGRRAHELVDGGERFFLGVPERPSEPHDLGVMEPAQSGELADRFSLAPPRRRVRPLPGATPVADVAAQEDRAAVDRAGGLYPEPAAHRRRGCLVDHGEPGSLVTASVTRAWPR